MLRCCSIIALLFIALPQALAQDRRPSLMVLPFVLEDGQVPRLWAVQAIQDSLATEAGRKQIAVVVAAPDRLAPPRDARDALAVARDNRADLVLFGVCSLDDQAMRVSAQLCDVASGKEIGKLQASGAVRDIIDIQDDLHRQLRGLVLNAPAVVAATPAPAPVPAAVPVPAVPAVATPDPGLSYRPTYDYSGADFAATGYGYYPAYMPMYVYPPDYLYASPFCGFYFGYYSGRWDDFGHRGHHGWQPYDHRQAAANDRSARVHDGATTLRYAATGASSRMDAAGSVPQDASSRIPRSSLTFRSADWPRTVRTATPSIPGDAAQSAPAPSMVRDVPRPAPAEAPRIWGSEPDSPKAPPPASVSRGGSDSPRASAPAPAPAPRAPVSSSPPRGGGRGR
ncbi:MAG: hypothetical protein ACHRHE_00865 [Tepidisphaerales bacterium]